MTSSGCDSISFFVGIGKSDFLKTFFYGMHTGQTPANIYGSLSDTSPDSNGFLAFVSLVSLAYFEKNRGPFEDDSPTWFFNLSNV